MTEQPHTTSCKNNYFERDTHFCKGQAKVCFEATSKTYSLLIFNIFVLTETKDYCIFLICKLVLYFYGSNCSY